MNRYIFKMKSISKNITDIVSNLINSKISLSDYELEMRFGNIEHNKFNTNITRDIFFMLFDKLTKNKKYKLLDNSFVHDKYYETGILRRIKKVDKFMFDVKNYYLHKNDEKVKVQYMNKEKINQFTYEYLRLSFNKETMLEHIADNHLKHERMKYRVSIPFEEIFRFDFTVENACVYSVEIEILLDKINSIEDFKNKLIKLQRFIKPICKILEKNIFENIEPAQPHTINYSDLFIIKSNKYTVTEKADGIRAFLKIKNNVATLINPKTKQIIKSLGKINFGDTLIDGEYVNNKFYAFDIMFCNNKDIRKLDLLQRLDILKTNISNIKVGLYINIKTFYKTDIFNKANEILHKRFPYNIDGLIFTPIDCYNSDLPTFKWKKRLTIDVRVDYSKRDDFTYFVFGKKYGRINEWSMQYFERNYIRTHDLRLKKMHKAFRYQEYQDLKNKRIHYGKYKTFNSKIFQTPYLGKPGKPNEDYNTKRKLNKNIDVIMDKYDIIEYEYRDGDWFPLRKRTFDKEEANALKTIDSIVKVIEENLTIEKMLDFDSKYNFYQDNVSNMYNVVAQDQAFKRSNWRKFHNYVKKKTIDMASNDCIGGAYLDLACGKGGDLQKYIKSGYKNILAIDTSEVELYSKNGYVHRLCNMGFMDKGLYFEKDDVKVTILCGDVSKNIRNGDFLKNKNDMDKLEDLFSRVDKFDVISIMFAIHYMLESDSKMNKFMNNIIDLIKPTGKFIGTYLNMKEDKDYTFADHGIPFYSIKNNKDKIEIRNDVWGWENVISEKRISKDILVEWFEENDLIEVYNHGFSSFYNIFKINEGLSLTEQEKNLGFLNNYFVMILSPQVINKSIKL